VLDSSKKGEVVFIFLFPIPPPQPSKINPTQPIQKTHHKKSSIGLTLREAVIEGTIQEETSLRSSPLAGYRLYTSFSDEPPGKYVLKPLHALAQHYSDSTYKEPTDAGGFFTTSFGRIFCSAKTGLSGGSGHKSAMRIYFWSFAYGKTPHWIQTWSLRNGTPSK
jgi:hypothetical protein